MKHNNVTFRGNWIEYLKEIEASQGKKKAAEIALNLIYLLDEVERNPQKTIQLSSKDKHRFEQICKGVDNNVCR